MVKFSETLTQVDVATSHSGYGATLTESNGEKDSRISYPNSK